MLSPDEITKRLRLAAAAVEEAELPDDLRGIAFERSLDALGVRTTLEAAAESGGVASAGESPPGGASGDSGHLDQIARRLGLDAEAIARVYENDAGQIRLIIKRAMLPDPARKAAAMRDVALLIVVGRQAAGLEEYTPLVVVRDECRDLNVLDGGNFATEIAKLEFRAQGDRNRREVKANRHHFDDAADLIGRVNRGAES